MMKVPHDDNDSLIRFYGNPESRVFALNLVPFVPPWQMLYKADPVKPGVAAVITPVRHFVVHKLGLDAFTGAFKRVWDAYGHDQHKIEADNLHWYGGVYAPRNVRGSSTKISCHAFAAALDLDPEHNPQNRKHQGAMPRVVVDCFKAEGFFWGGDFKTVQDFMHYQLAHE